MSTIEAAQQAVSDFENHRHLGRCLCDPHLVAVLRLVKRLRGRIKHWDGVDGSAVTKRCMYEVEKILNS